MTAYERIIGRRRPSRLGQRQRNVVLIFSDDEKDVECDPAFLRADMDDFRADGIWFDNARCVNSLCQPARMNILTGQYQQNNGVSSNGVTAFNNADFTKTLHALLWGTSTDRLVQIGQVGKFVGPGGEPGYGDLYPEIPHIDYFMTFNGPSATSGQPTQTLKFGWQATVRRHDYDGTVISEELDPPGTSPSTHPTLPYSLDFTTSHAIAAIEEFTSRPQSDPRYELPFLLTVGSSAPHYPVNEPNNTVPDSSPYARNRAARKAAYDDWIPPFYDTANSTDYPNIDTDDVRVQGTGGLYSANPGTMVVDERERMKSMVAVDDMRVAIEGALQDAGVYDDTVIIYVSDNGYMRGEHGFWEGKQKFYEASLQIPFGIRGPGFPSGVVSQAAVANFDIAPTICEIFNIDPFAEGLWTFDNCIDLSVITSIAQDTMLDTRVLALCDGIATVGESVAYGAMTNRYKVWYVTHDLYDLEVDPWEMTNQESNPAYATILSEMEDIRAFMRTCVGTECDITYDPPEP